LAGEDVVSEAKVTIMKIKINTKTTISEIELHCHDIAEKLLS
jgi:hypothetical protein